MSTQKQKSKQAKSKKVCKVLVDVVQSNNLLDKNFIICAGATVSRRIRECECDGSLVSIGFGCYQKPRIDYYNQ